jgi:hypothetical protein
MSRAREILFIVIISIGSAGLVLAACEAVFRAALFSDTFAIPKLQHAWRYADPSFEDDYWKLVYLFKASGDAPKAGRVDPELGWAPEITSGNPLGIHTDNPYSIEHIRVGPILFYGDSFVAGITPMPHRIPQILDHLIRDRPVLNYGVSGYGLDQIYLRFSKTVDAFENPVVLIGILTDDLDRVILGMRSHQKPYFDIENDDLVARNVPIRATTREYVESNPPKIRSYFLRFVLFRLRPYVPEGWFNRLLNYETIQRKKLALNYRILRAFKEEAKARQIPLYVVVFYSWQELSTKSWREEFLKENLHGLGVRFFDTKPYLLDYVSKNNTNLRALYDNDHGHPSEKGNRVIAEGLLKWLQAVEGL